MREPSGATRPGSRSGWNKRWPIRVTIQGRLVRVHQSRRHEALLRSLCFVVGLLFLPLPIQNGTMRMRVKFLGGGWRGKHYGVVLCVLCHGMYLSSR